MASSRDRDTEDGNTGSYSGDKEPKEQDRIECAVCLQPCVQPVQLPCKHIFCFLCVKGVTHQGKRCAMCRQGIPANYLDNPCLVTVEPPAPALEDSFQWFYEGRNGWWQYDERTISEIEAAYKAKETQCEVLIAGFLYVIDLENLVQYRRSYPSRRRKIKRDLITAPKKGVAGIRLPSCDEATCNQQATALSDSDNNSDACCAQTKSSTTAATFLDDSSTNNCSGSAIPSKRQ